MDSKVKAEIKKWLTDRALCGESNKSKEILDYINEIEETMKQKTATERTEKLNDKYKAAGLERFILQVHPDDKAGIKAIAYAMDKTAAAWSRVERDDKR